MAGAFVDGALKGFEMMERHQARKDNKARLADMDKRNDQRYQDSLERQAQLDEERKNNREQDLKWRESQAKASEDYRNSTLEANQQQRQWQQNYQTQQAQWQKDQKVIPIAVQSFRDTGKIPPELEGVMQRNKGMDPRTYLKSEYREAVKGLSTKLDTVIKSGNMAEANNPEVIKLFGQVFGDKIKASVGQYDETVKSKIASVDFAGFVPAERKDGSVALALQVTYENGAKEIKPMTKGRTSEGDDPVMTYTPKELVGTIKARAMMADMIERPEYWDKMGAQVGASFGRKGGESKADYQKKLGALQDDMTKAFAKIQSDSSLGASDEERQQAVERVKNIYLQRIEQLNKAYGIKSEDEPKEKKPKAGKASGNNDSAEKAKAKEDLANSILNGASSASSAAPATPSNSNSGLAEPGFVNGLRDGAGGRYKNEAKPIDYSDMSHLDSVLTQTGQVVGSLPGTLGDIGEYIGDEAISPALDWLTQKPSEKK